MLKADLHLHTSLDKEERINYSPRELINYMSKLNFKVISITHHNQVYYNQDIRRYARSKGVLLIPGVELGIKGKHVLIYNVTQEQIKKIKDFEDLERLKKENTIICAPHPFYLKSTCLCSILLKHIDLFDAIEYSHFYVRWFNLSNKAVKMAKKYNKTLIGNSDAHKLRQINTTHSLIGAEQNIDGVLEGIRKNKVKLVTKPLGFLRFLNIVIWGVFRRWIV